jgi:hypothetical protein
MSEDEIYDEFEDLEIEKDPRDAKLEEILRKKEPIELSDETIKSLFALDEIEIGTDGKIHGLNAALNRYIRLRRQYNRVVMTLAGEVSVKSRLFNF